MARPCPFRVPCRRPPFGMSGDSIADPTRGHFWRAEGGHFSVALKLSEHALGNPRVLLNTAGELLHAAAQKGLAQLDEKLYLETCAQATDASAPRRAAAGRRR